MYPLVGVNTDKRVDIITISSNMLVNANTFFVDIGAQKIEDLRIAQTYNQLCVGFKSYPQREIIVLEKSTLQQTNDSLCSYLMPTLLYMKAPNAYLVINESLSITCTVAVPQDAETNSNPLLMRVLYTKYPNGSISTMINSGNTQLMPHEVFIDLATLSCAFTVLRRFVDMEHKEHMSLSNGAVPFRRDSILSNNNLDLEILRHYGQVSAFSIGATSYIFVGQSIMKIIHETDTVSITSKSTTSSILVSSNVCSLIWTRLVCFDQDTETIIASTVSEAVTTSIREFNEYAVLVSTCFNCAKPVWRGNAVTGMSVNTKFLQHYAAITKLHVLSNHTITQDVFIPNYDGFYYFYEGTMCGYFITAHRGLIHWYLLTPRQLLL
jgi:hypothetical protein